MGCKIPEIGIFYWDEISHKKATYVYKCRKIPGSGFLPSDAISHKYRSNLHHNGHSFRELNSYTEKGFKKGDSFEVLKKDGDWWTGRHNGKEGVFPYNYVQSGDFLP